jgi:hypothetical protein
MQSIEGSLEASDFEETHHNDVDHFFDDMNAATQFNPDQTDTQFNPDQTEELNSLLSYAGGNSFGNSIEGV